MQAEIDARSQDVIRKESQVMIALRERDSSVQKLKDQEGIYWNSIIKYKQEIRWFFLANLMTHVSRK